MDWIARAMEKVAFRSIERWRETGYLAPLPMVLGEFAKALDASGQRDRALGAVCSALEHCAEHGSWWHHPTLEGWRASIENGVSVSSGDERL
jgi:hypothetical protein